MHLYRRCMRILFVLWLSTVCVLDPICAIRQTIMWCVWGVARVRAPRKKLALVQGQATGITANALVPGFNCIEFGVFRYINARRFGKHCVFVSNRPIFVDRRRFAFINRALWWLPMRALRVIWMQKRFRNVTKKKLRTQGYAM